MASRWFSSRDSASKFSISSLFSEPHFRGRPSSSRGRSRFCPGFSSLGSAMVSSSYCPLCFGRPEGRLVFPDEPLLEVTAPLPEAQLAETYLLNQVTYQTAIATKAARCRVAAPDKEMVDFAFRR